MIHQEARDQEQGTKLQGRKSAVVQVLDGTAVNASALYFWWYDVVLLLCFTINCK